jgi:hypothetical protein
LAAAIVWHTDLINDPEALWLVDTTLAEDAARFEPMSANKTAQVIDEVVDRYDPGALRHRRTSSASVESSIKQQPSNVPNVAASQHISACPAAGLPARTAPRDV